MSLHQVVLPGAGKDDKYLCQANYLHILWKAMLLCWWDHLNFGIYCTGILPGVCHWCLATGPGKYLIQLLEHFFVKLNICSPNRTFQLFDGSWPNNWCRHNRVVEQPCQCDVSRRMTYFVAQRLVFLKLVALFFQLLKMVLFSASSNLKLLQCPA